MSYSFRLLNEFGHCVDGACGRVMVLGTIA
jgi:hypothetical protein